MDTAENRCENCENVKRGMDDCSHMCHWISEQCPMHDLVYTYLKINDHPLPIELITGYTGCRHFKEDVEHRKLEEETEQLIRDLHAKRG